MFGTVFEEERRRVNAWASAFASGGLDAAQQAEREELNRIRREKDEADERNFRAFEEMVRQGQQIRRQREAAEAAARGDGSYFPRPGDQYNPFSGERIIDVPEDESLRLAREARWGAGATTALSALVGNVALPSDSDSEGSTNPASDLTLTSSGGSEGGDSLGPEDTSDDDEDGDDTSGMSSLRTSLGGEYPISEAGAPPLPSPSHPDATSIPRPAPDTERWTHMTIEEEAEEEEVRVEAPAGPPTPPPPPPPAAAGPPQKEHY
jgi:hypothetical protein